MRETEERVSRAGRRALARETDLSSATETRGAVERAVEVFGRLDVLVNAAGTDAPGRGVGRGGLGPDARREPEGALFAVQGGLPVYARGWRWHPRQRLLGGGEKGWANASAYCASKFGLTGLMEALADEGRPHGVRAIVVHPGAMATNWGAFRSPRW